MVFNNSDPRLRDPEPTHENVQDVVPPTERGQDVERTDITHGLELGGSRPLTEDERKAADRDTPAGERVYAPASERVPVSPQPRDREIVEHPDTHTPEREAAGETPASAEPAFTRVPRPSSPPPPADASSTATASSPTWQASAYGSTSNTIDDAGRGPGMRVRLFWLLLGIGGGIGVFLALRRQRERNKPINRLRRQARQAADEIRERVTLPDEAARPAMGLTTAILSILLLWWQQSQARARQRRQAGSRKAEKAARRANNVVGKQARKADKLVSSRASRASEALSDLADVDWQKRLAKLKSRWTPGRLEIEKTSISRH